MTDFLIAGIIAGLIVAFIVLCIALINWFGWIGAAVACFLLLWFILWAALK